MSLQRLKSDQRQFELIDDHKDKDEIFSELNTYIKYLFEFLWNQPKIVSNILSLSNIKDVKDHLAHFFTNNFYENILSNNNKEEQLLYIITSLLKKEINKMDINNININKIENIFLKDTPCGCIFEEFSYKKEIQAFFKIIIIDILEKIELSFPSQEIIFDPNRIKDFILLEKKEEEKEKDKTNKDNNKDKKKITFNKKIFEKDIEEKVKLFDLKYQFGLPQEDLEKKLEDNDIKNNKNMIDYINQKISDCSENPFLYSTEVLLENVNFTKIDTKKIDLNFNDEERKSLSKNILTIYKQNFFETIWIIDKLIDNLISNIHLLPYSIKCINKIISILINKKFPNLSTFQKNIFLSQFFFNKLFFTIFVNPAVKSLINDFIISDSTLLNLSLILPIINKFFSGQFYKDIKEEGTYTPFNWYFLSKMPMLLEFFEKSKNVKLPNFIEKIIDKDENEFDYNYEFDYFEENKDKMMFVKNICFSFDDFYCLYYNIKNNKEQIFKMKNEKTSKLEKALTKLIHSEHKIEKIKNEIDNIILSKNFGKVTKIITKKNTIDKEVDKKPTLKFFLNSKLVFKDEYDSLFNMESKKEYFNIKELKNPESNENIIIKAKNFICDFLFNFYSLDSIDLDNDSKRKLDTMNLLKEMKTYLKSSNLLNDEKIPTQWYINSIIEYLKKLPENFVENDYNELFAQLENDINNSIKLLNFEKIGLFVDKIKLAKKSRIFYDKAKKILIDIDLNRQAHTIIEKEIIPVQIKFKYSDSEKDKIFEISEHPGYTTVKERIYNISKYIYSNSNSKKVCQTIKELINNFPNITEYNDLQDLNVLEIMEELKIPEKLLNYFNYIGEKIKNLEIGDEKKINNINIKIYDYVMEKLYDKIFPKEVGKDDLKIFQNCIRCSWVDLKHFIKGKNDYILENFVPDTIKNFEQINKEKSPRKKLKCINKIFQCIYNLAQLNGDKIDGTDDSLPILNYALIKAKPFSIYSNCFFMKLFLGDKKNKSEGHQLSQLLGISTQIKNISSSSLLDISEEEFKNNCLLALQENNKNDINILRSNY